MEKQDVEIICGSMGNSSTAPPSHVPCNLNADISHFLKAALMESIRAP